MIYRLLLTIAFLLLCCSSVLAESEAKKAHDALLAKNKLPSAKDCGVCHSEQYREWSVSPHAYAQLSPVFNAMHSALVKRTNGTVGDFCIRCHTPVGMDFGEPVVGTNLNRHPAAVEGVTCITCHKRDKPFGKTSGRNGFKHSDIFDTIYGPGGNKELKRVIKDPKFKVNADREKNGRNIHTDAKELDQITTSAFCGTCHDVNAATGLRLEEAFSDYKSSPAASEGTSCQDCHMGRKPGVVSGYPNRPAAYVAGIPTKPRKHADHMFVGPDYSIVHPGIFPHNPKAKEIASYKEWLEFDYKAGWGTDDFEDTLTGDEVFPERWESLADRYEARELIEENLELLQVSASKRKQLLSVGYQLGKIDIQTISDDKIEFSVEVRNGTDGHSVPTGFDGERVVFLRVIVKDSLGKEVFKSGDLDPNGDLRDSHSAYVRNNEIPRDEYLFSLQSKFIINMVRGGDREEILPVNYSVSPLPFVRPPTNSTLLVGRPNGARKHRQVIPPNGSRVAKYRLTKNDLKNSKGPYTANIKLITGMVPVNLVNEIKGVGFDYNMSPREVADAIVEGHQVIWERELRLEK